MAAVNDVIGLDLSLTATGIATADGTRTVRTASTGMTRLKDIWEEVWDAVRVADETLVVLEGYSYGSGNQSHQMGELGGHIRFQLWDLCVPYVVVAPATLKRFATGAGNASKDLMIHTAAKLGCPAHDNNSVDAWFLREMGLFAEGQVATAPPTQYRTDAVRVVWPEL